MAKLVTHHKIGDNRGRKRIWLDGKRLTASGFKPGKAYYLQATDGAMHLTTAEPRNLDGWQVRKVSGKEGGLPVIDIVGATVSDTFGNAKRISAEWKPGNIVLERA